MNMKMRSTSSPMYSVSQLAMLLELHRTASLRQPSMNFFVMFPTSSPKKERKKNNLKKIIKKTTKLFTKKTSDTFGFQFC